jgi:hypothetical protein
MWFGSVHKNKGGRIFSQPPTRESITYAQQVNKLLSSPPKKRLQEASQKKSGNTYSNPKEPYLTHPLTTNPTIVHHPHPNHQTNTTTTTQTSQLYSSTFQSQVEEAFRKQNSVNEVFHLCIGQLEMTTKNIDNKMDLLLDHMVASSARKAQRTIKNMECKGEDDPHHLPKSQKQGHRGK